MNNEGHLEEKARHIKEDLNKMSSKEFNKMLQRNGQGKIKSMEDTTFFKAVYKDKICEEGENMKEHTELDNGVLIEYNDHYDIE